MKKIISQYFKAENNRYNISHFAFPFGQRPLVLIFSFFQFLFVFSFSQFLTSCELETSHNGNLDGQWHLVSVDTLSTGGVKDMSDDLVFWAFQVNMMEIIDHTYGVPEMFFRFNHTDGKLIVNQPYLSNRKDGDEPYDDLVMLGKVGINSLEEAFNVESLSSSNMILNNGVFRLRFKKM